MELDWTTFVLEIVNFLILLWILKRFLFRPVREAIARRQATVADTIAKAQAQVAQVQTLKQQYEGRMHDWDTERQAARARLDAELAQERERQLAALQKTLESERERNRAVQERRQQEQARILKARAADQASGFAARLLERLAGTALDARIVDVIVEDLGALPEDRRTALTEAAKSGAKLEIQSARPLADAHFERLRQALVAHLGVTSAPEHQVDPALAGGVRIALGPWVLEATLAHELAGFRESLSDTARVRLTAIRAHGEHA